MVYFITLVAICIAGITVSSYLSFSHYRVYTDMGYKSFCAISKAINCDTISQSSYAVFLNVPVAVWGIAGYCLLLGIILCSLDQKRQKIRLLSTQFSIALIFSLISLTLGIISSVYIHAYCIMCIASWIINFSLLYMFWLIRRRYENINYLQSIKQDLIFWKTNKLTIIMAIVFLLILGSLILFYPKYWQYHYKSINNENTINTGITLKGHPWIGAIDPKLTIVEFSDYQCFQCKKMHFFLRNLIAEYPDKLRIVHRHFPMDHRYNPIVTQPFHEGSGVLALIAITACNHNIFWEANDYLYQYDMSKHAIYLRKIAKDIGIDLKILRNGINKHKNKLKLFQDIKYGLQHKLSGTPAYIINGQTYTGHIPPDIIRSLDEN